MNLKVLNILLAVVLAILIGVWAFLILSPREMRPPNIDKELGLNRSQIQQLGKIRSRMMSEHRSIFRNIRGLNGSLDKELSKDTIDEAAVSRIEKEIKVQHERLAGLRVSAIVESRKILGAEKFAKMTDLFEKKRKERPMRWGHGPERKKNRMDKDRREDNGPPPPPEFGF